MYTVTNVKLLFFLPKIKKSFINCENDELTHELPSMCGN